MSSNRRFAFVCLSQLMLFAPLSMAQTPSAPVAPQDGQTVVARQGSAVVTLADVDAFAQRLSEKERPVFFDNPKRLEGLISNLLVQRQLAAEAEKMGLDKDASIEAQLKLGREDILGKARLERLRADLKLPNFEPLAREEYIGHKEKYVTQGKLDVQHVLISTDKHSDEEAKALAEKVQKEAKADPAQFGKLVDEYSEDPSKAKNHGMMEDARGTRYVPAFSAAAAALKVPGEISPLVKTKFGYHVLKLVTRTSDVPLKFDEVKAKIIEQLRTTYIEKAVAKHADELRNQPIDATPAVVASLRGRFGAAPTPPEAGAELPPDAQAPQR